MRVARENNHILRFEFSAEDADFYYTASEALWGDSEELLIGLGRGYREALAKKFAFQMLSAIAYLHERGIHHLDIKPQNVFVSLGTDIIQGIGAYHYGKMQEREAKAMAEWE